MAENEKILETIIVLRNDSTTNWAQSDYKLRSGEVGVGYMTRNLGNGETKQVPIIKVGDGNTAWVDLPQAEGVFEQDQIITRSFGRFETSNSKPVNAGGAGMTTSEWLMHCLSETKAPTITPPSFSLAASTITTKIGTTEKTSGNREVGSLVTKIKWDGTFGAGSYSYGYRTDTNNDGVVDDKDTWTKDQTGSGVTATYEVSCDVDGTLSAQAVDGTVTFTTPIELTEVGSNTIATVTNKCTWTASPRTPVNNIGTVVTGKIGAGSSEKSVTFSIDAYREGFFYGTTSTKTATTALTSTVIRGLSGKSGTNYSSGNKSVTVPVGAATIILACPASKTGVTKVYNNTVNADMTGSFTKTTSIQVDGANGKQPVAYNVWTFTPAEAYGTETSLTVTLGA